MFFEDEKDIIREGADIQIDEDGTVTWEDVLNVDDDIQEADLVSSVVADVKKEDDLEYVTNGDDVLQNDDVSDEELMKILNREKLAKDEKDIIKDAGDADFDIDAQLANIALSENENIAENQDGLTPRKDEKKPSKQTSPVLVLIFVIVLIAGVVYFVVQKLQNIPSLKQVSSRDIPTKSSIQQDLNDLTPEALEERQIETINQDAEENIPVVNEIESDKIKVSEEEKVEKKEIVKVVPTGRLNPFMPISKYATTSIPETNILYDSLDIPKPPKEFPEKDEKTSQLMSIVVSGIMYDEVKPSAIITHDNNDYFVQKGDKIDDFKIIEISKNYVKIALGKNIYKASIGEEFKVTDSIEGNAQFIPDKQGGGKQYYSATYERNNSSLNNELRYVSEDEIQVNAR